MQPPLRGCVLKRIMLQFVARYNRQQPPLRGCVLKQRFILMILKIRMQPPLRGCVLKLR